MTSVLLVVPTALLVLCTAACGSKGGAAKNAASSQCAARLSGGIWTPLDPKTVPGNDTGSVMANAAAAAPLQYTGDGVFLVQGGERVQSYTWTVVSESGAQCTLRQTPSSLTTSHDVVIEFDGPNKYKVVTPGGAQATRYERQPQ